MDEFVTFFLFYFRGLKFDFLSFEDEFVAPYTFKDENYYLLFSRCFFCTQWATLKWPWPYPTLFVTVEVGAILRTCFMWVIKEGLNGSAPKPRAKQMALPLNNALFKPHS